MTLEEKKKIAIEFLRDYTYPFQQNKDGTFSFDLYANYDDCLSERQIATIVESDDPEMAMYELLDEAYMEAVWYEEDNIRSAFQTYMFDHYPDVDIEDGSLWEIVRDYLLISPPYDHYWDQDVCVDIMLDTGDGNYDFALNPHYPCYYGNYQSETIDNLASIVWLIKQQGYKKSHLLNVFKTDAEGEQSDFLKSIYVEEANLPSHMATLTFMVRMTVRQLAEINKLVRLQDRNGHFYDARKNPYCGYIVLDKSTPCGLYDPWCGGGSVLDIQLEHDVRIPAKFIWRAVPDGAGPGYGIGSVYGMCESAWQDTLKKIHEPKGVAA